MMWRRECVMHPLSILSPSSSEERDESSDEERREKDFGSIQEIMTDFFCFSRHEHRVHFPSFVSPCICSLWSFLCRRIFPPAKEERKTGTHAKNRGFKKERNKSFPSPLTSPHFGYLSLPSPNLLSSSLLFFFLPWQRHRVCSNSSNFSLLEQWQQLLSSRGKKMGIAGKGN